VSDFTWAHVVTLARDANPEPPRRVELSDEEWRTRLSADAFHVLRQSGTERPFSSPMCTHFEPGLYACAGCGTPLFDADEKFDSRSGWPSFTRPVDDRVIAYHEDRSHGMHRIETRCNVCDGHLGHVFPDGPPPTGLRFCINAVALQRVSEAS
jgi:peptide-methionine (R)-S-oxide reductase